MAGKLVTFSLRVFVVAAFLYSGHVFAKENNENEVATAKEPKLFEMSIEQLMEVEVVSTATLTESKPRLVPAAVTTITAEDIQASGARSLFELLDIYVPNLQWWHNEWESDQMGLRGIMGDRDDKYLLLVNGRVMNERTHYGAMSERDLVFMGDIHHIDVVRGPGSALYGPGAVAMVINIVTYSAATFQGNEVTGRLGAIEEFYSGEVKRGQKFKDGDGGYFVYAGVSKYDGASEFDAPKVYGIDFPSGSPPMPWDGLPKGTPLTSLAQNDNQSAGDIPPMKFYTDITKGNWDVWARYTRGGKELYWPSGLVARYPVGWSGPGNLPLTDCFYLYQQATGFIGYKKDLNEKTNLEASFSYDMLSYERRTYNWWQEAYREDKYITKLILRREIATNQKVALGTEILHGEYGYPSLDYPHMAAYDGAFPNGIMPRWRTNMYSLFAEHQWTINKYVTSFLGGRVDDHTFTDKLYSPRASLVITPDKKDTFKLLWSKSVRANYEEELKKADKSDSKPETLDELEFRYERKHNEHLDVALSVFKHYSLELIGYSALDKQQAVVGNERAWGIEAEATYHTKNTRLMVSHSYTKLLSFELANPAMVKTDPVIQYSSQPYGYGDDLQRWSNHITKIVLQHKLDDRWTLDGSLRCYWGYPGLKEYAMYKAAAANGNSWFSPYPFDWERTYQPSLFLNLGLQYKPKENLTLRVDGYNLLGIFDHDLNHRNYGGEGYDDYRCAAPAIGVSVSYKF